MKLKNTYFLLRHGRNIHQTKLKDICYGWPDDEVPCKLDDVGMEQALMAGEKLKECKIDLIYASPVLRTKQTAEIVADILGIKTIYFEKGLRDMNWGVFAGGPKKKVYEYYKDKDLMNVAPKKGESWSMLQRRVVDVIKKIEANYFNKNILIVSHKDPILLLEAFYNNGEISDMQVGEIRRLN